jgi:tRNA threonylcarbamoyladenosine biosynthesis protein TsaB
MLLALDTSTALTGLACYDESGLLAECTWHSGRNYTAQLLPQLHMLIAHMQRTPQDIRLLAVALGPGSWSGLRVGLSLAKGMALAGGLPLIGIGTLDVLAYQQPWPRLAVHPLIRLGRERFATARYETRDAWQRLGDYMNVTLAELCAQIDGPTLFCGDIDAGVRQQLEATLAELALFPTPAANLRRPAYLAELAWQRHLDGAYDTLSQLEPIYLGDAVQSPKAKQPKHSG